VLDKKVLLVHPDLPVLQVLKVPKVHLERKARLVL
jgi:hypothetical protein